MTTETNSKSPLQIFKRDAVRIKIWEQSYDNTSFATASVGKIYKDKQTGEFRESRSFDADDLQKLQEILPEANQEMAKWQDYYRETQRTTQPERAPVHDMAAERDAVMRKAKTTPENSHTQEHAQSYMHEPEQ